MIVSRSWLADYLPQLNSDSTPSLEQLTDRLTMSGLNLEEWHAIGEDVAIDLEVTSNRPDCLGHIGIAREVSVLFNLPLTIPKAAVAECTQQSAGVTSVNIQAPDQCHQYHARILRGVRVGPSPEWLRERLRTVGINSVNNVVDVTNYVMLECGQPLHAFDFERLHGQRIVVRRGRPNEIIRAIDQREYRLTEDMCVIADADRAVAIAGVMGGLDTEISVHTTSVLIETASFSPLTVRSTARALKLHSPSSYRFERRVDCTALDWASRRCCELIMQVAGGELLAGSVVTGAEDLKAREPVTLRFRRVDALLGLHIPPDECIHILTQLGLQCQRLTDDSGEFVPPGWRMDLTRECDLIEEIARIHGYEHIPDDSPLPVISTARTQRERVLDGIRSQLTACGLFEAMTLSFVSDAQRTVFRPRGELQPVTVSHSSRSHENQLRQSLIPSLLQCRRQNERHGNMNAELFEIARVYLAAVPGDQEHQSEPMTLSLVTGRTFSAVRGLVELLVSRLAPHALLTAEPSDLSEFVAGRGAKIRLNNRHFGWIGELERRVGDALDLVDSVSIAELDVHLLEELYEPARHYAPLPRFPLISRDLNFVLPETVSWSELTAVVTAAAGDLLYDYSFGGQYRGKQIDPDCKSYVITCRFLAPDRTLTAEEVDGVVLRLVSACEQQLSARLR